MSEKLWFVNDGMKLVGVFFTRSEAEWEYERFREDPDFDYYKYYYIDIDDLEGFPDEYDFALEQDVI